MGEPFEGVGPRPSTPTRDFGFPNVIEPGAGPSTGLGPQAPSVDPLSVLRSMNEKRADGRELLSNELDEFSSVIIDQIRNISNFVLPHAGYSERIFNPNYKAEKALAEARIKANSLQSLLPAITSIFQQRRLLSQPTENELRLGQALQDQAKLEVETAMRQQTVDTYRAQGGVMSDIDEFRFVNKFSASLLTGSQTADELTTIDYSRAVDMGIKVGVEGASGLFLEMDEIAGNIMRSYAVAGATEQAREDKEDDPFNTVYKTASLARTALWGVAKKLQDESVQELKVHRFQAEDPRTRRKFEATKAVEVPSLRLDDALVQAAEQLGLTDRMDVLAPHLSPITGVGNQIGIVPGSAGDRMQKIRDELAKRN